MKRDSFAHYFSTVKENNQVAWTPAPLDSLLDVDKVIDFWSRRGLILHQVRAWHGGVTSDSGLGSSWLHSMSHMHQSKPGRGRCCYQGSVPAEVPTANRPLMKGRRPCGFPHHITMTSLTWHAVVSMHRMCKGQVIAFSPPILSCGTHNTFHSIASAGQEGSAACHIKLP